MLQELSMVEQRYPGAALAGPSNAPRPGVPASAAREGAGRGAMSEDDLLDRECEGAVRTALEPQCAAGHVVRCELGSE